MVPAPTAWTEADAPPPRTRMAISMPMFVLRALKTEKTTKRPKEMIYIVRRPRVSEKEDLARVNLGSHTDGKNGRASYHHSGKIDMESM